MKDGETCLYSREEGFWVIRMVHQYEHVEKLGTGTMPKLSLEEHAGEERSRESKSGFQVSLFCLFQRTKKLSTL